MINHPRLEILRGEMNHKNNLQVKKMYFNNLHFAHIIIRDLKYNISSLIIS